MATIETRHVRDPISGKTVPRYRVKVRIKGAAPVTKTFRRKTDAVQWAEHIQSEMRLGRYDPTPAGRKHTVAEAIERYEREVLPRKPRTAPFQKRQLKWWKKELGHRLLAEVTASVLSSARAKLLAEPSNNNRSRGGATANRYTAVMSHLLSVAVREWEWLNENPAGRLSKLREPPGRQRFLNHEEARALLEACRASAQPDLYGVVLIAMSTGMRRNEILWLR
jgi:integrase